MLSEYKLEERILASFISDISIDNLHNDALKYLHKLKASDFANTNYAKLLLIMQKLDNANSPISEPFIANYLTKDLEHAFISVYATIPDVRLEDNIKLLKIKTEESKIKKFALQIVNDIDVDYDKMRVQIDNVQNITSKTQNKKFNIAFLKDKYLTSSDIKDANFEFIIDNFIVKNELTMIAAKPGSGKSLTTVAIANHALIDKFVSTVIYFDLDNSVTTLKQRALNHLLDAHKDNFIYLHSSKNTKNEIFRIIKRFQNMDLSSRLFVFDSAKNFMMGGDRDKNKDVSKLTDIFKSLRDKGATVIFLHHTNKPSKDLEDLVYSGSSAWEEDTTNAYILNKNDNKNTFIFKNFKNRVGDLHNLAFSYNDNHTLTKLDYDESSETEEDAEIKNEIISYLKENKLDMFARAHTKTLFAISKLGFARNKVNTILKRLIDKIWYSHKQTINNRTIYTLIVNNSEEVNKSNKPYLMVSNPSKDKEQVQISDDLSIHTENSHNILERLQYGQ